MKYNPSTSCHCADARALRAARRRISLKTIHDLRKKVADRLELAYWEGHEVHGISVRDLVHEDGKGITDYLTHLRTTQWASVVEITYAAEILGVSVELLVGDKL